MPWPTSHCDTPITTCPEGSIQTQSPMEEAVAAAAPACAGAACASGISTPPAAGATSSAAALWSRCLRRSEMEEPAVRPRSLLGRCGMDGLPDAVVGGAAAQIGHGLVDLRIGGLWMGLEQRGSGHDHAGLAVAALRHVLVHPGLLDGVGTVAGQPFDGRDRLAAH